jgi:hypothetical protein
LIVDGARFGSRDFLDSGRCVPTLIDNEMSFLGADKLAKKDTASSAWINLLM